MNSRLLVLAGLFSITSVASMVVTGCGGSGSGGGAGGTGTGAAGTMGTGGAGGVGTAGSGGGGGAAGSAGRGVDSGIDGRPPPLTDCTTLTCESDQEVVNVSTPGIGTKQCACLPLPSGGRCSDCTCGQSLCALYDANCLGFSLETGLLCAVPG